MVYESGMVGVAVNVLPNNDEWPSLLVLQDLGYPLSVSDRIRVVLGWYSVDSHLETYQALFKIKKEIVSHSTFQE
jgi:hypothetical protein